MMFISYPRVLAFVVSAFCFTAAPAGADIAEFYKGQTIQILIGSSAGGGFDAYGRLVARNIGRHIPGNPNVLPVNMPGAGSATAVRYLETRPKDGTVIVAFNSSLVLRALTNPEKTQINFTELAHLGSVSSNVGVCFTWHGTGIKTWDDLAKQDQIVFGASGKASSAYMEGALLKNLFNLPVRVIIGYPGSNQVNLAVQRGEIDGNCGTWQSIPEDWRRNNKINVMYTYSKAKPKGVDAPYILDLAKNEEQKKILNLVIGYNNVFRPYAVAQGVPKDRLEALRDALWAMVQDEAFLAEAARINRPIIAPVRGEKMEEFVVEMYDTPLHLVKKAATAIK